MYRIKDLKKARDREMHKWTNLYCPALALALKRYWGYGGKRIQDVVNKAYEACDECAGRDESMIQILDEEAGIELRSYTDNRSYKDTFLLGDKYSYTSLNDAQKMCLLISEIRWMRPQVLAILLLAMYRQQGFGYERLSRLIGQMDEIIYENNEEPKAVLALAETEANFVMKEVGA